jgi:hypothetical protein
MLGQTARGVRIKTLSTSLEEWEEICIQSLVDKSDQDLDDDLDVPNIPVLPDVPDRDGNYYGDDESSDSEPETNYPHQGGAR